MSLSIVFPTYNEEANIQNTVSEALEVLSRTNYDYDILIVDNHSTDSTPEIINQLAQEQEKVSVIHHPQNLGYAASTRTALKNAKGELIFIIDSDGQHTASDIPKFVEKAQLGYGLIVGWKKPRHDPVARIILAKGYNFLFRRFFKLSLHDVDCGFKAYKKDLARKLKVELTDVPVGPEVVARAKALGYPITEVKIKHFPRKGGASIFSPKKLTITVYRVFKSLFQLKRMYKKGLLKEVS
ncbi:glycosyltransferase family 2 protein [Candidatus Woesearchaeota archaeon]|nr:glycosyltransferase family 2 protein [Candidatus Woesearchaeota archaeon]